MDKGAWQATVHGVAKSRTRLGDFTSLHTTVSIYQSLHIVKEDVGRFSAQFQSGRNQQFGGGDTDAAADFG